MQEQYQEQDKVNVSLTIKNIYGIGFWSYQSVNDKCPICNIDLSFPTIINNEKHDAVTIINECMHGFHNVCLNNMNCMVCKLNKKSNVILDINSDEGEDY